MTVREEDDSRDPPGSLHFASRCLIITSQKILPPNCLTTRFHAIVNVVNKQENYTTTDNTRDPAARPVVFQFQRRSSTAHCAGAVARLAHAYAFIKHMTSPVDIFFLSEIG